MEKDKSKIVVSPTKGETDVQKKSTDFNEHIPRKHPHGEKGESNEHVPRPHPHTYLTVVGNTIEKCDEENNRASEDSALG
jgi:hypothetical protein